MLGVAEEDRPVTRTKCVIGFLRGCRRGKNTEDSAAASGHFRNRSPLLHKIRAGTVNRWTKTPGNRTEHIADAAAKLPEVTGFKRMEGIIRTGMYDVRSVLP